MILKDGKVHMPFGTPGNDIQPQAMVQTLLNIAVFGMDPQTALEAPRFATYSFPSSSAPHSYHPGRLNLEAPIGNAAGDVLAGRGHEVKWWPEIAWPAGAVCAIVKDEKTGVMSAAADPRRPAYALGW
jgi:gamma-glutamyltranspeptidase/glutathione hydrolase